MGFAHRDGRGRRAEARDHTLDPVRGIVGDPAAMLAAVCTDQFTSMRPLGGADGAEVRAAWPIVISRTVELDAQADERRLRLSEKQVELSAPHRSRSKPGMASPSCSRCHWLAALMQVSLPA